MEAILTRFLHAEICLVKISTNFIDYVIVKNIIDLETHHPPMTYGDGDQGYRAGRAGDRPAAAAA